MHAKTSCLWVITTYMVLQMAQNREVSRTDLKGLSSQTERLYTELTVPGTRDSSAVKQTQQVCYISQICANS